MNVARAGLSGRQSTVSWWRSPWFALLLSLGWILFLYRDTGEAMVRIWSRSDTFTHGFLVIPTVLWLVWRKRDSMQALTPLPILGILPFVFFAGLMWLLGELATINSVAQLAFIALLVLSVPLVMGRAITRVIWFPLVFLFFAVPMGEFLLPQLMQWTADFTVSALRLSGVPVYREGLNFVIPSGRWSVMEACSGVRYLIASITVGALYAYLNYQSPRRRILFVMVALVVPVVANWLRAYMIVMIGHLSDNKLATGVDHLLYGWIFFGFVILAMFIVGARWSDTVSPTASKPVVLSSQEGLPKTQGVWVAMACLVILVALPPLALSALDRRDAAEPLKIVGPPALTPIWQPALVDEFHFQPAYQNPTTKINATYTRQGQSVGLFIAVYRNQSHSHKLVSSENVLVASTNPRWTVKTSESQSFKIDGVNVPVRASELHELNLTGPVDSASLLVWQIYWINGTLTGSDYLAKAYAVFYRLLGQGDDSATIVIYTPKGNEGAGEKVLGSFLATNYASINKLLQELRHNR